MPGCRIRECEVKEFDSADVLTAMKEDGEVKKTLEGKVEVLGYDCLEKISALQVVRNLEAALRKAGYQTVFSGKAENESPALTVQNGAQWIAITTWGNPEVSYQQVAVKVQQMEQAVQASADAWAEEINKSGRVAVYGIQFDTGKAEIKPESEKVLAEIVTLLGNQADWKLRVEGHTDSVGAKAANQALSQQRAQAVVAWLAAHGIDKARLAAQGFGDSKPVADNSSEEGRARNRRVELAKM
jgi:outer membrane protein OmpA-like peptidoglycan-associated protein